MVRMTGWFKDMSHYARKKTSKVKYLMPKKGGDWGGSLSDPKNSGISAAEPHVWNIRMGQDNHEQERDARPHQGPSCLAAEPPKAGARKASQPQLNPQEFDVLDTGRKCTGQHKLKDVRPLPQAADYYKQAAF